MKTIIIPAHNSEAALKLFNLSLRLFKDEQISVRFLQVSPLPDNYNDLLTIGRTFIKSQPFNAEFVQTIRSIKENYGEQLSYHIDHIYGDTPAIFRNYVDYRSADLVMYDNQQWQDSKKRTGLNIFKMVSRCGCELMYVSGDHLLQEEELLQMPEKGSALLREYEMPASILHQYNALDARLNELNNSMYKKQVFAKKFSNLSRYFISEDILQKILSQSECSLLLLKK